jgi:HEAT repeat protein
MDKIIIESVELLESKKLKELELNSNKQVLKNLKKRIGEHSIKLSKEEISKIESNIKQIEKSIEWASSSDIVKYWEDSIYEKRSALGFFSWTEKSFVYKGENGNIFIKPTSDDMQCSSGGKFYDVMYDALSGTFKATYKSNYYSDGSAKVTIRGERKNLPSSLSYVKMAENLIKEKKKTLEDAQQFLSFNQIEAKIESDTQELKRFQDAIAKDNPKFQLINSILEHLKLELPSEDHYKKLGVEEVSEILSKIQCAKNSEEEYVLLKLKEITSLLWVDLDIPDSKGKSIRQILSQLPENEFRQKMKLILEKQYFGLSKSEIYLLSEEKLKEYFMECEQNNLGVTSEAKILQDFFPVSTKAIVPMVASYLTGNYKIGSVKNKKDSFFEAVAQGLVQQNIQIPAEYEGQSDHKKLRMICDSYAKEHERMKSKGHWLKEKLGTAEYQDYLFGIKYTDDEARDLKRQENIGLGSGLRGRHEIDGKIICDILNIKLHVVNTLIIDNKVTIFHQLMDNQEGNIISEEESRKLYRDPKIIHIASSADSTYYMPIVKEKECCEISSVTSNSAAIKPLKNSVILDPVAQFIGDNHAYWESLSTAPNMKPEDILGLKIKNFENLVTGKEDIFTLEELKEIGCPLIPTKEFYESHPSSMRQKIFITLNHFLILMRKIDMGLAYKKLTETLLTTSKDKDSKVIVDVAKILGARGAMLPEVAVQSVTKMLLATLKSEKWWIRNAAAQTSGRLSARLSQEDLGDLTQSLLFVVLKDEELVVRDNALQALRALGTRLSEKSLKQIIEAIPITLKNNNAYMINQQNMQEKNNKLMRTYASKALEVLGSRLTEVSQIVIFESLLVTNKEIYAGKSFGVLSTGQSLVQAHTRVFLDNIKDGSYKREAAVLIIGVLSGLLPQVNLHDVIEVLLTVLKNGDMWERVAASEVLGVLSTRLPEADLKSVTEVLLAALKDRELRRLFGARRRVH